MRHSEGFGCQVNEGLFSRVSSDAVQSVPDRLVSLPVGLVAPIHAGVSAAEIFGCPAGVVVPRVAPVLSAPANPTSNTGSQTPISSEDRKDVVSFVDAVSLTYSVNGLGIELLTQETDVSTGEVFEPVDLVVRSVKKMFGHDDGWSPCAGLRGKEKYTAAAVQEGVYVLWNADRLDMGVHVCAMGSGCRTIENRPYFEGWKNWFNEQIELNEAKFTRLDLAIDDAPGKFGTLPGVKFMYEKLMANEVVMNATSFFEPTQERKWNAKTRSFEGMGRTLPIGERKSETYIRAYDKGAEIRARGGECAADWVRVEMELKRDRAHAAACLIANSGMESVPGMLKAVLDFKEPNLNDSHKHRWATVSWWDKFLGAAEKSYLKVRQVPKSIERTLAHIKRQYAPTLLMLMNASDDSTNWVREIADSAVDRVKSKHAELLERFKASGKDFDLAVRNAGAVSDGFNIRASAY